MDDIDYQAIKEKLDNVTFQNKQLRRANLNKDKTIKHLRRVIKKLKDDAAKDDRKPHFRKGQKRGERGFHG
jgi:isochorismate synthase EntC